MDISVGALLDLLSGALIILVGAFVLKAKPDSPLHRLFCAFAVADGVSTMAFGLSEIPSTAAVQLHARLLYYASFIGFVALLLILALTFPRPMLGRRWRTAAIATVGVAATIAIVWQQLDPYAFWIGREEPDGIAYTPRTGALLVIAAWLLVLAGIVVRVTRLFRTETSPSHRLQASVVLGGMALGYTPYATTTFLDVFRFGPGRTLLHPDPAVAALYLAIVCVVAAFLYALSVVLTTREAAVRRERSLLLYCFGGVLLLTLPAVLLPGRAVSVLLQQLGLVAWPLLLAYAIARYEILDIGPAVRRTATISLATTVLGTAFFVAEAILENALESTFAGALGTPIVAVFVAAAATALVFAPISSAAKRLAKRVAPDVAGHALRTRQLEIYRHGVEAAVADGELSASDNRVLTAMRASFSISEEDHARILGEAQAAKARRAAA